MTRECWVQSKALCRPADADNGSFIFTAYSFNEGGATHDALWKMWKNFDVLVAEGDGKWPRAPEANPMLKMATCAAPGVVGARTQEKHTEVCVS